MPYLHTLRQHCQKFVEFVRTTNAADIRHTIQSHTKKKKKHTNQIANIIHPHNNKAARVASIIVRRACHARIARAVRCTMRCVCSHTLCDCPRRAPPQSSLRISASASHLCAAAAAVAAAVRLWQGIFVSLRVSCKSAKCALSSCCHSFLSVCECVVDGRKADSDDNCVRMREGERDGKVMGGGGPAHPEKLEEKNDRENGIT